MCRDTENIRDRVQLGSYTKEIACLGNRLVSAKHVNTYLYLSYCARVIGLSTIL